RLRRSAGRRRHALRVDHGCVGGAVGRGRAARRARRGRTRSDPRFRRGGLGRHRGGRAASRPAVRRGRDRRGRHERGRDGRGAVRGSAGHGRARHVLARRARASDRARDARHRRAHAAPIARRRGGGDLTAGRARRAQASRSEPKASEGHRMGERRPADSAARGPELVIATGNPGKLREIREILASTRVALRSLGEFPDVKMPDEGDDYAANAAAKARAVALATGRAALADDSGLEVDALAGRPGPFSARYGGAGRARWNGRGRLLSELAGARARGARFVCMAALVTPEGAVETARGECRGEILAAPRGSGGFGYDPVFRPRGEAVSMAELPAARKNEISHRALAVRALRTAIDRVAAPVART